MADDFRDTFAPEVSAADRRRIAAAESSRSGAAMAGFAAVLAILLVVGGVALTASGGAGTDRPGLVIGLGIACLVVAVPAAAAGVRGGLRGLRRRQAAGDLYLGRHRLAGLAERAPEHAAVVRDAQRAVDRIRASEAFRDGTLSGAVDGPALDRIEWAVVGRAVAAADSGAEPDPDGRVGTLTGLADTAARIDARLAAGRALPPVTDRHTADELDRAAGAAAEVESYLDDTAR